MLAGYLRAVILASWKKTAFLWTIGKSESVRPLSSPIAMLEKQLEKEPAGGSTLHPFGREVCLFFFLRKKFCFFSLKVCPDPQKRERRREGEKEGEQEGGRGGEKRNI